MVAADSIQQRPKQHVPQNAWAYINLSSPLLSTCRPARMPRRGFQPLTHPTNPNNLPVSHVCKPAGIPGKNVRKISYIKTA